MKCKILTWLHGQFSKYRKTLVGKLKFLDYNYENRKWFSKHDCFIFFNYHWSYHWSKLIDLYHSVFKMYMLDTKIKLVAMVTRWKIRKQQWFFQAKMLVLNTIYIKFLLLFVGNMLYFHFIYIQQLNTAVAMENVDSRKSYKYS